MISRVPIVLLLLGVSSVVNATQTWTSLLTDWSIRLHNGVAYIYSSTIPSNCQFGRAQIDTNSTIITPTNQRDIYAFALASYMAGRQLSIVVDTAETTCVVYGASN